MQCVFRVILGYPFCLKVQGKFAHTVDCLERWLSKKRKNEGALNTLARICRADVSEVQRELTEIKASLRESSTDKAPQTCLLLTWRIYSTEVMHKRGHERKNDHTT